MNKLCLLMMLRPPFALSVMFPHAVNWKVTSRGMMVQYAVKVTLPMYSNVEIVANI